MQVGVLRRTVGAYAVTLGCLLTLNFVLPRTMPGDPLSAMVTDSSPGFVQDDGRRAELEAYYGLGQPLPAQFLTYVSGLARGDLGTSVRYQVPVTELLAERLPPTLLLVVVAVAVGTLLGVAAGAAAGWRRGRPLDRGLLTCFTTVRAVPVFFLASLVLFVFAVRLDWFPIAGSGTLFAELDPLRRALDVAHHLALPAAVLALQFAAAQFLVMRAAVIAELGADHLLVARAKGLRDRVVRRSHVARNALLPVTALLGVQAGVAVTSSVLVETVFRYEGVGRLLADAIQFRDYPLLQGCFLVLTLTVVGANLLTDLLQQRLDPRVIA